MNQTGRFGTQSVVCGALLALLLASCSPHGRARGGAAVRTIAGRAASTKSATSGAGLFVCEPVPAGADVATASFGDGCALWLHYVIAGQGALGKTPAWRERAMIPGFLERKDARLPLET